MEPELTHSDSTPAETLPPDTRKRILFVDDEPNFLAGLRRLLRGQRAEWDLYFAGGVDEALELLRRQPVETIVTDVNMPRRNAALKSLVVSSAPERFDWV